MLRLVSDEIKVLLTTIKQMKTKSLRTNTMVKNNFQIRYC